VHELRGELALARLLPVPEAPRGEPPVEQDDRGRRTEQQD